MVKKILIAEDQLANFIYLEESLSDLDYEIIHSINGAKAVEEIKTSPDISLILMDLRMPIMDGFEATEEIHKINSQIPIIAQTAFTSPEIIIQIKNSGFVSYLSKPIEPEDLINAVKKYAL
jgi:CheY-like chemotaxis protein